MKNIISLLVVMILTSCSDSKSKLEIYSTAESTQSPTAESNEETIKEETKSNKERESYIIDMILKNDAEKIGLISVIKNVPHEKINSVLKDYLSYTYFSDEFKSNESSIYIEKIVDSISSKNKLPKKLTASLIFSYNYEMITKDEIIDDHEYLREEYLSN
jgi:uncharacterized protein YjgD (DUF1641 family)